MTPIISLLSPRGLLVQWVGLFAVFAAAVMFVWRTRTRRNERNRRAGLGIASIIGGPLVGLGLAFLVETSGEVLPMDLIYNRWLFGIVGTVAGIMAAIFFASSAALATNETKPPKFPTDDLL